VTILRILIITGVAPFNNVALPSNHPPSPPLKLNLNFKKRKKRKKKRKRKKRKIKTNICIINQDCVPFEYHENEYIHNVIGVAKRYFLNLDLKTEVLGDYFISLGIKL
jgi:hypothetical protein